MPLNVRPLNKALQEKAIRELNEDPDRIEEDVRHIQEWIRQQPHLNARTDDQFILNFLRSCKFDLQQTKEKIDLFYTTRTQLIKYLLKRDPFLPEIQKIFDLGLGGPLSKTLGDDGPRIFFGRYKGFDPTIAFESYIMAGSMVADVLLNEDDNFIIAGQHGIGDAKGAVLDYVWGLDFNECLRIARCGEYAYPANPKSLDALNAPPFYKWVYNLAKPFLSKNVKEKLHIYTDDKELWNILPRSHIPKEYGGDGDSLEELGDYWKKKIQSYKDYFVEDRQYVVDESKRPGKVKTSNGWFSMPNFFRLLNIDALSAQFGTIKAE